MKDLLTHTERLIQKEQEKDIIERAKENPRHFQPLYDKYYTQIFRFLLKRHAAIDLAEELCSQCFLKALTKLYQYKPKKGAQFSSWLYKIALNESNAFFRAQKKSTLILLEESISESIMDEVSSNYTEHETEQLSQAVQKLKKKQVELLQLRFYEGLSFKEIGEVLDITENNAKVKCYRIIDQLRLLITKS